MKLPIRSMNRMSIILFVAFFVFSLFFIMLISYVYNLYWEGLFKNYYEQSIKNYAFMLLDDMRERGIDSTTFTVAEKDWLERRTRLYGVLVQIIAKDSGEVLYDSLADIQGGMTIVQEFPYIVNGQETAHLKVAFMNAAKELNPAMVNFRETLEERSKFLFGMIIAISIAISFWLAYILTKHLKRLDQYAKSIRSGKWVGRCPENGPVEIRRLALTLNELSSELQKQEEWRKSLMEDITHELRTPITSIMMKVEAITDGIYEADQDNLKKMYEELERLSRLVSDLQRLSEAEGAQFDLRRKNRDIVKLAKQVYVNCKPLARNKGVTMVYDPVHTPTYAQVDYDKMYQVITNIVANAIKYTPSGGRITLKVSPDRYHTRIICEDNGIGISVEDLPYIFNRLYRADKSRSRFTGGVGLGLTIAKALTEAHGGTIEVESEPSLGSIFTIIIPNASRSYE